MAPTFGASVICPPGLRDGVLEQFEEGLTRFANRKYRKQRSREKCGIETLPMIRCGTNTAWRTDSNVEGKRRKAL